MSSGIDIKIGSSFDASGITEANKSLAKLAQDVGSANQQLRQATLKAAADINSYAYDADKACRAIGGGYKDASQFVKDAMGAYLNASKSVKQASGAFDDFNAVMRRAAEAVDKRNANIKQAAEVYQVLEKKQRELAAITDTSSEAYKRASRNVEILKQALSSLGVKASGVNKPVEAVPSRWRTALSSATGHVKGFASAVGRNLMNIQAGFNMSARAVKTFVSVLSKGMEYERMTVQFKSLTGSMELAKAHMRDLQDLGRTPPFSLEQFSSASQAMLKMTGGMAGFKKEMEIVGDMAAATGNDIATVGRAFGLAYQVIRDGQDFGRAGQQLYSLGIMTKKQVAEFAELSKAGTDNMAVWEKLQEVFGRYKGAMADTEKTTKGLVEAIQGEATVAMTDFSSAITDAAKPALEGLLGWLKRINEDGTIEGWADSTVEALHEVAEAARYSGSFLSKIGGGIWKGVKATVGTAMSFGAGADQSYAEGGSFLDQIKNGASVAKEMWNQTWEDEKPDTTREDEKEERRQAKAEMWNQSWEDEKPDTTREDEKEERRQAKAEKRAEAAAKVEEEAKRRVEEDMAKAQKKKDDERRAANFDEYKASGSTDTFEKWLADKAKKDAKALTDAKTEYAKYLKEAGIDEVSVSDIDGNDTSFKKWRENHDKKINQEIADAKRVADERLAAEKKAEDDAHKLRIDNLNAELKARMSASQDAASAANTTISNAQTEFDNAFAMYRSKDKGAAQIAEERDYAADYKQLQKDAARYGGKWRIDELSSLIAAGDTKGQAAKLEEWRKSSSFTPEVESMVRAAAADQTRTTAEDELRKISNNTADLSKKLDELLQVK